MKCMNCSVDLPEPDIEDVFMGAQVCRECNYLHPVDKTVAQLLTEMERRIKRVELRSKLLVRKYSKMNKALDKLLAAQFGFDSTGGKDEQA